MRDIRANEYRQMHYSRLKLVSHKIITYEKMPSLPNAKLEYSKHSVPNLVKVFPFITKTWYVRASLRDLSDEQIINITAVIFESENA